MSDPVRPEGPTIRSLRAKLNKFLRICTGSADKKCGKPFEENDQKVVDEIRGMLKKAAKKQKAGKTINLTEMEKEIEKLRTVFQANYYETLAQNSRKKRTVACPFPMEVKIVITSSNPEEECVNTIDARQLMQAKTMYVTSSTGKKMKLHEGVVANIKLQYERLGKRSMEICYHKNAEELEALNLITVGGIQSLPIDPEAIKPPKPLPARNKLSKSTIKKLIHHIETKWNEIENQLNPTMGTHEKQLKIIEAAQSILQPYAGSNQDASIEPLQSALHLVIANYGANYGKNQEEVQSMKQYLSHFLFSGHVSNSEKRSVMYRFLHAEVEMATGREKDLEQMINAVHTSIMNSSNQQGILVKTNVGRERITYWLETLFFKTHNLSDSTYIASNITKSTVGIRSSNQRSSPDQRFSNHRSPASNSQVQEVKRSIVPNNRLPDENKGPSFLDTVNRQWTTVFNAAWIDAHSQPTKHAKQALEYESFQMLITQWQARKDPDHKYYPPASLNRAIHRALSELFKTHHVYLEAEKVNALMKHLAGLQRYQEEFSDPCIIESLEHLPRVNSYYIKGKSTAKLYIDAIVECMNSFPTVNLYQVLNDGEETEKLSLILEHLLHSNLPMIQASRLIRSHVIPKLRKRVSKAINNPVKSSNSRKSRSVSNSFDYLSKVALQWEKIETTKKPDLEYEALQIAFDTWLYKPNEQDSDYVYIFPPSYNQNFRKALTALFIKHNYSLVKDIVDPIMLHIQGLQKFPTESFDDTDIHDAFESLPTLANLVKDNKDHTEQFKTTILQVIHSSPKFAGPMAWVGDLKEKNALLLIHNLRDRLQIKTSSRLINMNIIPELLNGFGRTQSGAKPVESKASQARQDPKSKYISALLKRWTALKSESPMVKEREGLNIAFDEWKRTFGHPTNIFPSNYNNEFRIAMESLLKKTRVNYIMEFISELQKDQQTDFKNVSFQDLFKDSLKTRDGKLVDTLDNIANQMVMDLVEQRELHQVAEWTDENISILNMLLLYNLRKYISLKTLIPLIQKRVLPMFLSEMKKLKMINPKQRSSIPKMTQPSLERKQSGSNQRPLGQSQTSSFDYISKVKSKWSTMKDKPQPKVLIEFQALNIALRIWMNKPDGKDPEFKYIFPPRYNNAFRNALIELFQDNHYMLLNEAVDPIMSHIKKLQKYPQQSFNDPTLQVAFQTLPEVKNHLVEDNTDHTETYKKIIMDAIKTHFPEGAFTGDSKEINELKLIHNLRQHLQLRTSTRLIENNIIPELLHGPRQPRLNTTKQNHTKKKQTKKKKRNTSEQEETDDEAEVDLAESDGEDDDEEEEEEEEEKREENEDGEESEEESVPKMTYFEEEEMKRKARRASMERKVRAEGLSPEAIKKYIDKIKPIWDKIWAENKTNPDRVEYQVFNTVLFGYQNANIGYESSVDLTPDQLKELVLPPIDVNDKLRDELTIFFNNHRINKFNDIRYKPRVDAMMQFLADLQIYFGKTNSFYYQPVIDTFKKLRVLHYDAFTVSDAIYGMKVNGESYRTGPPIIHEIDKDIFLLRLEYALRPRYSLPVIFSDLIPSVLSNLRWDTFYLQRKSDERLKATDEEAYKKRMKKRNAVKWISKPIKSTQKVDHNAFRAMERKNHEYEKELFKELEENLKEAIPKIGSQVEFDDSSNPEEYTNEMFEEDLKSFLDDQYDKLEKPIHYMMNDTKDYKWYQEMAKYFAPDDATPAQIKGISDVLVEKLNAFHRDLLEKQKQIRQQDVANRIHAHAR